jgi:hypothetical protein
MRKITDKEIWRTIIFGLIILLLTILIIILVLGKMNERIDYECAKTYYEGTIKFWDGEVNCSIFKNMVVNNSLK